MTLISSDVSCLWLAICLNGTTICIFCIVVSIPDFLNLSAFSTIPYILTGSSVTELSLVVLHYKANLVNFILIFDVIVMKEVTYAELDGNDSMHPRASEAFRYVTNQQGQLNLAIPVGDNYTN